MRNMPIVKDPVGGLMVYGAGHAAVDATCAAVIFYLISFHNLSDYQAYYWVLTYGILAFGTQALFGRLTDALGKPRAIAVIGSVIVAVSALVAASSVQAAVFCAGIGNALFHVSAGTVALNLTPNRASGPGLFVAPGGLGLFAGIVVGKAGLFVPWPFVVILAICCLAIVMRPIPPIDYKQRDLNAWFPALVLICVALLASVFIRSFVGMAASFPWKSQTGLLVILTIAVVVGKATGGLLADRYGWRRVAVTALVVSAPLIALGSQFPVVGIVGALVFNLTMAVTLSAMAALFPGRPGFAFGLCCLALIAGALPAATHMKSAMDSGWVALLVILCSAGALFVGLRPFSSYGGKRKDLMNLRPSLFQEAPRSLEGVFQRGSLRSRG